MARLIQPKTKQEERFFEALTAEWEGKRYLLEDGADKYLKYELVEGCKYGESVPVIYALTEHYIDAESYPNLRAALEEKEFISCKKNIIVTDIRRLCGRTEVDLKVTVTVDGEKVTKILTVDVPRNSAC